MPHTNIQKTIVPDRTGTGQTAKPSVESIDSRRLMAIEDVTSRIGRGVFKRIDENRELFELLKERCPQFLNDHPWVEGWLESHDDFFVELARATQAKNPFENPNKDGRSVFPRPWPGKPRQLA